MITGIYSRTSSSADDMFGDLAIRQKVWHRVWDGHTEYYVSGQHVEARHPSSSVLIAPDDQGIIEVDETKILSGLKYDTSKRRFTDKQYLSVRITG